MPAKARVLLFASARQAVGHSVLERTIPKTGLDLARLLGELVREYPALAPVLRVSRFIRNGSYLRQARGRIRPGDELAIHPPYSGG